MHSKAKAKTHAPVEEVGDGAEDAGPGEERQEEVPRRQGLLQVERGAVLVVVFVCVCI